MRQGHTLSLSSNFLRRCSRTIAFRWIRPPPREYEGICSTWGLPAMGSAAAHTAQQRACADAHATHMHPLRSTAHMRTMRMVYAEYVSVPNTRRRRIIRAHAHYLRICATAHHLRSCTCAHTLRAHLLRPCAASFVHAALGHAAFAHARIVIQGAAEAAAGSGSPPPPKGPRRGGGGW